ncbi:hypothetical protein [Psychrobacter pygoscelis]|uniref:hypothetical protein n=1 Tax=Psychrobacter pygoscelis TaxID=2488563 RepID=UPI0013F405C9|nr:hypothetical protein [Psychrobacter pygoscelis]
MNCDNCPYPIGDKCCHLSASADDAAWRRELEHTQRVEELRRKNTDKEKPQSVRT